ncbi:MAG: DUF1697 domain-containing protein [Pyrinomonadaceae bacterium]
MYYAVLLRGINVGGNKKLPMKELRKLLENAGFENVQTYIQSGNVVLETNLENNSAVETAIFELIRESFFEVHVIARSIYQIESVIAENPFAGEEPDESKFHLIFAKERIPVGFAQLLTANASSSEEYAVSDQEIYCHLKEGVIKSLVGKGFMEKHIGKAITARNLRTVKAIAKLVR